MDNKIVKARLGKAPKIATSSGWQNATGRARSGLQNKDKEANKERHV